MVSFVCDLILVAAKEERQTNEPVIIIKVWHLVVFVCVRCERAVTIEVKWHMRFVEMKGNVGLHEHCRGFCCSLIHLPVSASEARIQQNFAVAFFSRPFHGMGYALNACIRQCWSIGPLLVSVRFTVHQPQKRKYFYALCSVCGTRRSVCIGLVWPTIEHNQLSIYKAFFNYTLRRSINEFSIVCACSFAFYFTRNFFYSFLCSRWAWTINHEHVLAFV